MKLPGSSAGRAILSCSVALQIAAGFASPATAQSAPSHDTICRGLESKATELMDGWRYAVEEIANDAFDEKQRRLRDRYDMIHIRLEYVRDDARREGCNGLPEAIESVFRQWERP